MMHCVMVQRSYINMLGSFKTNMKTICVTLLYITTYKSWRHTETCILIFTEILLFYYFISRKEVVVLHRFSQRTIIVVEGTRGGNVTNATGIAIR